MKPMLCEVEGGSDSDAPEVEIEQEVVGELKTLQMSLQSKMLTSNMSFNVWGEIERRRILTLIDSSATSNFIVPGFVRALNIKVADTPIYVV